MIKALQGEMKELKAQLQSSVAQNLATSAALAHLGAGTTDSNGNNNNGTNGNSQNNNNNTAAAVDPNKLNQRLKEMFKEKISMLREAVYLLTGFKVKF